MIVTLGTFSKVKQAILLVMMLHLADIYRSIGMVVCCLLDGIDCSKKMVCIHSIA